MKGKKLVDRFGPVAWFAVLGATLALSLEPLDVAAQAGGCVDCSFCFVDGSDAGSVGNKAPPGDATSLHSRGLGSHRSCFMTGGCNEQHPIESDCIVMASLAPEVMDALMEAALDRDHEEVYRIAVSQSKDGRIYYLAERNAVQVLGCNDTVMLHVPLPSMIGAKVAANVAN